MGMVTEVKRFDVCLVDLDPTQGFEIKKTRPCLVVSPDEMNQHIKTVIVAPMTTIIKKNYPTRITVSFQGKSGQIVLDQIRTIDKSRVIRSIGSITPKTARQVSDVLVEMFTY